MTTLKTLASLFAFCRLSNGQSAPVVPAVPVVPSNPNPDVVSPPALAFAPPGKAFGAFNNLCDSPATDSACQMSTDAVFSQNPGFTKCEKNYDCCLCSSVQCGDMVDGCTVFSAGNYGVLGVKAISIIGRLSGAHINCIGTEACAESEMIATQVKDVSGASLMALKNARIAITRPLPYFTLECIDQFACEGLNLEIIVPKAIPGMVCGPLKETLYFNQIMCVNSGSCRNLHVTIINEGCQKVVIGKLQCVQTDSCDGAVFDFVGDVQFQDCQLRGSAGTSASGIETCFDNLQQLNCQDPTSCRDAGRTLMNPVNGFLLKCDNVGSCQSALFNIHLDGTADVVTYFEGFKFSAQSAGAGVTVLLNNRQNGAIVNIQRIECSALDACAGATFIIGHDVSVGEIICQPGACHGCKVQIDVLSPAIPCDPNDVSVVFTEPPVPVAPVAPVAPVTPAATTTAVPVTTVPVAAVPVV